MQDVLDPNGIGNKVTLKLDSVYYADEIETTLTKDEFIEFQSMEENKEQISDVEKYEKILTNFANYFEKILL